MGIEPTPSAWKAEVLPLNYTRLVFSHRPKQSHVLRPIEDMFSLLKALNPCTALVEGGGFEPPKAEPADLQSAPFDRSGTPPAGKPGIMR